MNAVANLPAAKPSQEIRAQLDQMQPQFALALPEHVSPEKFVRVVMTAVQGDPKLLGADRQSLFAAAMKCAQDGLLPDGREAALVTFRSKIRGKDGERDRWVDKVQYMPMVAGILSKVRRSGELKSISANVVYSNDHFDYVLGDDERIEHKPFLGGDRGEPILAYAIAHTKDGGIYREVMAVQEIEFVRQVSRAKDDGPWVSWWSEMARKTVIRRLSKRLPMSTDLQAVIERDDALYDLKAISGGKAEEPERLHAGFGEPSRIAHDAGDSEPVHTAEFTDPADDKPDDNPPAGGASEAQDGGVQEEAAESVDQGGFDFPGDRKEPDEDLLAWASGENVWLETATSVAEVDERTSDPANVRRFMALKDKSPGAATALNAAIKGRRKALLSKESAQ